MGQSSVRLVVGLGNPGVRYEWTRHNVGFMAVDRWVEQRGGAWGKSPVGDGEAVRVGGGSSAVWAAKPATFMNLSGAMVQPLAGFFKIDPGQILVVSDDLDLPFGRLRIRLKGSAGGQNGLASVLERLGTQDVPRLRLGIGPRPAGDECRSFVLGRFRPDEEKVLPALIVRAAEAIEAAVERGVSFAMNEFNKEPS